MEEYDLKETQNRKRKTVNSKRKFLVLSSLFSILSFPLYAAPPDGYVVKVESATVYLDWGLSSGVKAGDQFLVYRIGAPLKHPVTGEILGHEEETLAHGSLDRVEDKFSIGRLVDAHGEIRAGDRTRSLEVPSSSLGEGNPRPDEGSRGDLQELWRSEPLKEEAVGLVLADIEGNGQKDLVMAARDKIEVFRIKDNHLEAVATYKDRNYRYWVAVDAADLTHQGRDEIFASAMYEAIHRPHTVVLRYENGTLKSVADIEGFVRSVERAPGGKTLILQSLSRSRDVSFDTPAEVIKSGDKYALGTSLKVTRLRDDQLFGFTFGDWDGDHAEDLALLQGGESLRVFFQGIKWSSSDSYGGTKNDFTIDEGQIGSVVPRLIAYQPAGGKEQLIVSHNIPELGIHMAALKLYKKSELFGLAWNGLAMAPVWHVPVDGYLADFAVGEGLPGNSPQLWAAVIGPGHKTILVAYGLP